MSIVFDHPLAEYVDASEHEEHARVASLVARYHTAKARAINNRLNDFVTHAQHFEAKCDSLAKEIEEATL